ncbi:MAG TPA: hypothetical protein PLO43_01640, partial [Chlamydiales bacterium]|nr:hypothetical protein [Chlamydiales bacterium]
LILLSARRIKNSKEAANLICLSSHLLGVIIPEAFKLVGGRNFGRWRDQGQGQIDNGKVIPWLAVDTPAITEFGYHYEALVKHFMTALQLGIEEEQVKQVASSMRKAAEHYMHIYDEQLNETAEAKEFASLTGLAFETFKNPDKLNEFATQLASCHVKEQGFNKAVRKLIGNDTFTPAAGDIDPIIRIVLGIATEWDKEATFYQSILDAEENAKETFKNAIQALSGVWFSDIDNPEEIKRATNNINDSLSAKLTLEAETAATYVSFYQKRLSNNAQTLPLLFNKIRGMTGTPWNADGYHPRLADNQLLDEGTEGSIIQMLIQRASTTPVHTPKENTITAFLEAAQAADAQNISCGVFDSGALLRDYSSLTMAKDMLQFHLDHNTGKKGVLFFYRPEGRAKADQFAALVEGSSEPIHLDGTHDISKAGLTVDEYAVYLPELQTTGTDIKFPATARASVTIDKNIISRKLLQTMLRLRKFFDYQNIELIVPEDLINALDLLCEYNQLDESQKTLQKQQELLTKATLLLSICNQGVQKANSIMRHFKQQVNEVPKIYFRKMTQQKLKGSIEALDELEMEIRANVYSPFMTPTTCDELFNLFFGIVEDIDTMTSLEQYANRVITHFKHVVEKAETQHRQNFPFDLKEDALNIEKEIRAIVQRFKEKYQDAVPTTLRQIPYDDARQDSEAQPSAEIHQEVQIEIAQELEIELEMELQTELAFYEGLDGYADRPENKWSYEEFLQLITGLKESKQPFHIKTLKQLFECYRYQHGKPYGRLFTSQTLATENYRLSKIQTMPIFHRSQKPPGQILIVEKEDRTEERTYVHLLVSEKEAAAFKIFLQTLYKEKNHPHKIWLVTPGGKEFIPNWQHQIDTIQDSYLNAMTEINIFGGHISNLLNKTLYTPAKMWFENSDSKIAKLKNEFIRLRTWQMDHERDLLRTSGLIIDLKNVQNQTVARMHHEIATASFEYVNSLTSKDKTAIYNLTPRDILRLEKPDIVHCLSHLNLRHLQSPVCIQAVNIALVKHLVAKQIPHLLPSQLLRLTTFETIRAVTTDQIGSLRKNEHGKGIEPVDVQSFIQSLSNAQVSALQDKAFLSDMHKDQLPHIGDALIGELRTPAEIETYVPGERVNALHPEALPNTANAKLPSITNVALIQALPADRLGHIDPDMLLQISDNQISQLDQDQTKLLPLMINRPALATRLNGQQLLNCLPQAKLKPDVNAAVIQAIKASNDPDIPKNIETQDIDLVNPKLAPYIPDAKLVFITAKDIIDKLAGKQLLQLIGTDNPDVKAAIKASEDEFIPLNIPPEKIDWINPTLAPKIPDAKLASIQDKAIIDNLTGKQLLQLIGTDNPDVKAAI